MNCGVYAIYDRLNNECLYVGQSGNIAERWRSHVNKLKSDHHLVAFNEWFNSINKDFTRLEFKILELCENTDEQKNRLEIKWFYQLQPRFFGKTPSGEEKWAHSLDTKSKISRSVKTAHQRKSKVEAISQCLFCGETFTIKRRKTKYCSAKCYHSFRRSSKNANSKKCSNCGDSIADGFSKNKKLCIKCSQKLYALSCLTDEELLFLHDEKGYSWTDIAHQYNVSKAAVSQRVKKINKA